MAVAKNNLLAGKNNSPVVEKGEINPGGIIQALISKNKKKLDAVLGDNAGSFAVSLINLYTTDLQGVDPTSVLNSAFIAAVLKLPIEKNLGFAYIIKYKDQAQFQLGYKGMMQLALRSGGVKKLNAIPIYEGQIKSFNPLTEDIEFDFSLENRENIIGYAAYMELVNGFNKTIYCTKEEIENHAQKFSQSYKYDINYKKKSSVWSTQFNEMALKTMIKKILKFAPLSTEMQLMQQVDQAKIKDIKIDDGGNIEGITTEYIDNDNSITDIVEADVVDKPTTEDMQTLMTISQANGIDITKKAKELYGVSILDDINMEQYKELKEIAING